MHMSDLCTEIARMGKGIGNENRYRIFEALVHGPRTVGELAVRTGLAQPAVSQNLKTLKEAELVHSERRGQEVFYSIDVAYMGRLLKKLAEDVARSKPSKK